MSLASLTPTEIRHATAAFAAACHSDQLVYYEVALDESISTDQKRAALLSHSLLPPRRARVVASHAATRTVFEGTAPIDVSGDCAVVRRRSGVQPALTAGEYSLVEKLVREHPPFVATLHERGIDTRNVMVDTWCVGWSGPEDDPHRRLAWPVLYLQRGDPASDTLYAQPLEGFAIRVDLWATPPAVVSFEVDSDAPLPLPPHPNMRFPHGEAEERRPPLLPLRVSQPEGTGLSFDAANGRLTWQRWEATVSFNAREGAVMSALKYDGRPVAWRLSFAEMVVP